MHQHHRGYLSLLLEGSREASSVGIGIRIDIDIGKRMINIHSSYSRAADQQQAAEEVRHSVAWRGVALDCRAPNMPNGNVS